MPPEEPIVSRSAEAAAIRWSERNPDDDVVHPPPPSVLADAAEAVRRRASASAEAAALRWHEENDEE